MDNMLAVEAGAVVKKAVAVYLIPRPALQKRGGAR